MTQTTPSNSQAVERNPALDEFTEYFVRNYPGPNTIIRDPHWHAPKIFRAAIHALRAELARQQVVAAPVEVPFRVSVCPLSASNGVTYVVCLDSLAGERITPVNRNDISEANSEGEKWAEFLGVPFVPCEAITDIGPVNTVPEYGAAVQDKIASRVPVASLANREQVNLAACEGGGVQARLLTPNEILQALVAELNVGVKHTPHEIVQRMFCEVNRITLAAPKGQEGGK